MKSLNMDFVGKKKLFALIAVAIICVGLICNIFLPTKVDIQFTGGTIVKYSYSGEISEDALSNAVKSVSEGKEEIEFNYNVIVAGETSAKNFVSITLTKDVTADDLTKMLSNIRAAFPTNNVEQSESSTVEATMGKEFFLKCLAAIAIAAALMMIYVAFRFRKIGGWSAGLMALVALVLDVSVAYFAFVIFRIELDDNFVAVILSILGYSLNSTIVIFDRVRTNRRVMGAAAGLENIVNTSIQQSFGRALNTTISTLIAVGSITVVAVIYGLEAIISFSVPMMAGIISGFYSSVFLSTPLWVAVRKFSMQKREAKAVKQLAKKKA